MEKITVVYFSATGTTEKVAGYIKNAIGGDLFEIEPKEAYTDADLNYNTDNSRANNEQNVDSARPEIAKLRDEHHLNIKVEKFESIKEEK